MGPGGGDRRGRAQRFALTAGVQPADQPVSSPLWASPLRTEGATPTGKALVVRFEGVFTRLCGLPLLHPTDPKTSRTAGAGRQRRPRV
jgi:hypothetical protein